MIIATTAYVTDDTQAPVGEEWPHLDPVEWRLDFEGYWRLVESDFYEATLAHYCLTSNNVDGLHFQKDKTLDNIIERRTRELEKNG